MSQPVVRVPVYPGDGTETVVDIICITADFPRGPDGTCAFCQGDPCAERSALDSAIGAYMARNSTWAETCPMCLGRPT